MFETGLGPGDDSAFGDNIRKSDGYCPRCGLRVAGGYGPGDDSGGVDKPNGGRRRPDEVSRIVPRGSAAGDQLVLRI